VVDPKITSPYNGSTVDFGVTAVNTTLTYTVNVKAEGLTQNVAVSVAGAGFKASAASIAAADANVFQLDKNLVLFGCGDRAGGVAHLADAVHDCNFHCAFHKMTSVFACLLTFIKCL
jgi:hypothetical protein